MNSILELAISVLIVRALLSNISVFLILRRFRLSRRESDDTVQLSANRHLMMLLKVFEEHALIEETVLSLSNQIAAWPDMSLMVVGTERERNGEGRNPTLDKARLAAFGRNNVQVIEAPIKANASHAWQNNYALDFITTEAHHTWIMTLDIDSRFTKTGLNTIVRHINDDRNVIQESCVFLANYRRLGLWQRAHALYQSRWTISHEIRRILIHNATHLSVAHVVGHGLCIRLSLIRELRGFPEETPMEDINLGFYLVAMGEHIESVKDFEMGDTPETIRDGLRQEYAWSLGARMYPMYLRHFAHKFPAEWQRQKVRLLFLTLQGTISYINWLSSSWIVMIVLVNALLGNVWASLFLLIYIGDYFQCAYFFWQQKWISVGDVIVSPALALMAALRRSLGADAAFVNGLTGREIVKHKTPHHGLDTGQLDP